MGKKRMLKRKVEALEEDLEVDIPPPASRSSDEPIPKKAKWINRTRVLVFATRGITHRDRHLLQDLRTMLPHSRDENKMERGENFLVVNELCSMKNCDKCILLEGRGNRDLYMWFSSTPSGPSAKFLVESVFTMGELKLTGNSLKGSRPLLSFDETFNAYPQYSLLKELFIQIFGTPAHHPKSQPFNDRVITFSVLDNRIWFRNYQILTEDGALAEIGPRFVLNPIKIFESSFGGRTIWDNPKYVTPGKPLHELYAELEYAVSIPTMPQELTVFDLLLLFQYRQLLKLAASNKYVDRKQQKEAFIATQPKESYTSKPNDDIFEGNPLEKAKEISEKVKVLKDLNQQNSFKKQNLKKMNKKNLLKKQAIPVERSSVVIGAKSRKKVKKNKAT